MAKSKGNYYTLRDLLHQGIHPLEVRYLLLSVPYRRKLNFTFDALHQARSSLRRLDDFQLRLRTGSFRPGGNVDVHPFIQGALEQFEQSMDDDLNTAQALAALFDLVREMNILMDNGLVQEGNRQPIQDALERMNRVFDILEDSGSVVDGNIERLIEERLAARRARNFALADQIRSKIYELGYIIEDTREGTRCKKR